MHSTKTIEIPQDIFDIIIHQLSQVHPPSLKNTSLVTSSWRYPSQRHLFSDLRVTHPHPSEFVDGKGRKGFDLFKELLSFFQKDVRISGYVRNLALIGKGKPWQIARVLSLADLTAIISTLPHLRDLTIQCINMGLFDEDDHGIVLPLVRTQVLALENLSISEWFNCTSRSAWTHLFRFLMQFKKINSLHLGKFGFHPPYDLEVFLPTYPEFNPIPIISLSIVDLWRTPGTMCPLIKGLVGLMAGEKLKEFHLEASDLDMDHAGLEMGEFVRRVGGSLRILNVDIKSLRPTQDVESSNTGTMSSYRSHLAFCTSLEKLSINCHQ
ncbi:hypothetical protein C8Q75DRAFT_752410 [Abortiporus biennis]|nr:hypothetical protein C8Q75DRAFT_752410 [Abortiporus biennis]